MLDQISEPLKPTRREFLKIAGTACAGLSFPSILPATALGRGGVKAPSERIVIGAIGLGGRGSYDLTAAMAEKDVQVVAVCDVRREMRERAKASVNQHYGQSDCAAYIDFRELLSREDIDAVIIAPGDRWHTPMSVLAMKSGKDVYSEKPGTMTVAEGRILVDTARRYSRIFQTGTQRRSEANFVLVDQLARLGRLGEIHTVRAHTLAFAMKQDWLPAEPEPAREDMAWDLWLGPAPWRPYNAGYLNGCGAWLDYYDFGTGVAGWCSHTVCQCQGAIDADLTSPVEYEYPNNETADGFTAGYANGVKLVLSTGGWHGSCGVRYEGSEGWASVADGYDRPEVSSPSLLDQRVQIVQDYMDEHRRPMNHMRDFLDGVKSRRLTVAHPEVAHRSMSTCHAVNICMLLKRPLRWDPDKEEFVNDPEANRMRSRATREPWRI